MAADGDMAEGGPGREDLLLQRYLDGELRAAERSELEDRLRAEPELAVRLERLLRLQDLVRAAESDPAPLAPGFADRVLAAARQTPEGVQISVVLGRWTAVAAAVLAAAAFGLMLRLGLLGRRGDGRLEAESRARARYERAVLERLDRRAELLVPVRSARPDETRNGR